MEFLRLNKVLGLLHGAMRLFMVSQTPPTTIFISKQFTSPNTFQGIGACRRLLAQIPKPCLFQYMEYIEEKKKKTSFSLDAKNPWKLLRYSSGSESMLL